MRQLSPPSGGSHAEELEGERIRLKRSKSVAELGELYVLYKTEGQDACISKEGSVMAVNPQRPAEGTIELLLKGVDL